VNLGESFRFAVLGVTANKMRSALTTLGMLIGVASVIALVSVGNGSGKAVQDQIASLGSNTLTVTASQGGTGGRGGGGGGFGGFGGFGGGGRVQSGTQTKTVALTLADASALTDKVLAPDVTAVAPVVSASSVVSSYDGATHTISTVTGTSASYFTINNDSVQAGVIISDADYTAKRRVVDLGSTAAKDLFGGDGTSAVGKTILMGTSEYQVIGVLTSKGSTGPTDSDDRAIAPLTAVQDTLAGYTSLSSISVQASSAATTTAAEAQVTSILDTQHKVTSTTTADFTVSSASSIVAAATSSTKTFTILLAAVAGISLLVGGIGVMNIMLVTVTERTREIGIRKAIGAGQGDIVSQFLFEAVLLSIFGGLAGVFLGLVVSRFQIVGVQPVVAPLSVALAFGVAVTVGLFFGLYPASRAASLRPIDALRYE
jgi:putative ABC transport system permease protein